MATAGHTNRWQNVYMKIDTILLVICSFLSGCSLPSSNQGIVTKTTYAQEMVSDELGFIMKQTRNHTARFDRLESSIIFKKDNGVILDDGGTTYTGIYTVDADGIISLTLDDYPGRWPDMFIRSTRRLGAILCNIDQYESETCLIYDETPSGKHVWPFFVHYDISGKELIKLVPPQMPIQSEFNDEAIHIFLDVYFDRNGKVTSTTHEIDENCYDKEQYVPGDWQYPYVENILNAAMEWRFSPYVFEGVIVDGSYVFDVSITKDNGNIRCLIKDHYSSATIYDSKMNGVANQGMDPTEYGGNF